MIVWFDDALPKTQSLRVICDVLAENGKIPYEFSRDGANVSPPLRWEHPPSDAQGFAVVCDDPDALTPDPFVHWIIWNLPADVTQLPKGVSKTAELPELRGAVQGRNDFGDLGYDGPQPPRKHGPHRYRFRVVALSELLTLGPGSDARDALAAMHGLIVGWGEIVGMYERHGGRPPAVAA